MEKVGSIDAHGVVQQTRPPPLAGALNHRSARERCPHLGLCVLGPGRGPILHFTRDPQSDVEVAEA